MSSALQTQLDAYRVASSGGPNPDRRSLNLATYAAAAGSALALASGAEAAIIYSGTLNTQVPFTHLEQYSIDIDGDGFDDFTVDFDVAGGWLRANAIAFELAVDGSGSFGNQAQLFTASQTLDAGANVQTQGWLFVQSSFGSVDGPWGLGAPGFAGFFTSDGLPAWIRLAFEDTVSDGLADRMRVLDWAYDDTEDRIHIGSGIPVPAPTPLALLALGAIGLAATRRRRARRD